MTTKEKKGFKHISKKFLSSFRKEKKLHDISELHEDQINKSSSNDAIQSCHSVGKHPKQGSYDLTGIKDGSKRYQALALSPQKTSKNHFKRILNRASFSNVRSIAKEHPDLLRNITSPHASRNELGASRSGSTDSGIDCSILVSDKGSPEKFVVFTRREAERLRQEFVNESVLETVTEVDSRSSLEDEDEHSRIDSSVLASDNVANESLEDKINHKKEQIVVLTKLKTVLSGKLKEFDHVSSDSPILDDENYVVMTPPTSTTSKSRINHEIKELDEDVDTYFLNMHSNKTDEIKVKETRKRQENNLSIHDRFYGEDERKCHIVNPFPILSTQTAGKTTLPSTPAPATLLTNENSAFLKCKSVKRSVSDAGKELFGKLRNKKKDQDVMFLSKDDCITVGTRKKQNKLKAKSMKKNKSFSFDGEHNVSLDYLNSSDINFKSLDDHTSIIEDLDSIQPIGVSGKKDMPKKVLKETVERRQSQVSGSITEMTNGICEMTSALCASQRNSAESIACICDCKNRNLNSECCERRKSPPMSEPTDVIKTGPESKILQTNRIECEGIDVKINNVKPDDKSGRDKPPDSLQSAEILNKSIRNTTERTESIYVNIVNGQIDGEEKSSQDNLDESYSDSECDCCDCCSQGCDCSHSDEECSDPNCPECIAEFKQRKKYGNISSSCDSLSENDGLSLDKSIRNPYPNWVHSSDDHSTSSSTRSSPLEQVSVLKKVNTDEPSPEPMRITTKFNSSPNSINSFNMESSFSVSFREVDFENGEVMYKLDNSLSEGSPVIKSSTVPNSDTIPEQPINPALRKMVTREKQYPYSCTPSPSTNVTPKPNKPSHMLDSTDYGLHKNEPVRGLSDKMAFSVPKNLSMQHTYDMKQILDDPYDKLSVSESPLNLTFNENYHIARRKNNGTDYAINERVANRSLRNERRTRPDYRRGQKTRSSLLSMSLNESQMLQNNELLQNKNYSSQSKRVSFNQSLNESMLFPRDNRKDASQRSKSSSRYPEMIRSASPRSRLSRSFSDAMDLNRTSLNESCVLDSSMYDICNSPLDLSVSKPRSSRGRHMSPKPLDLSMSRLTSPADRMHKQAKWVDRHVGQIYSPAKRVLHKNQGLSEKDLCKQILDLYVSEPDDSVYNEPQSMMDSTMDSSMMVGAEGGINAEDSILQYGTYLAPRHVVKETNVDDFTTTVRTCYTGEARTRKLPADVYDERQEKSTRKHSDGHRKEKIRSDRRKSERKADLNSSRSRENVQETRKLLNQSAEHIYEEIPSFYTQRSVLKDRTNNLNKRSSLKQQSSKATDHNMDEADRKTGKKDIKELSEKSFDNLTMLHTAHNGQRKVKCLSMDESLHVVKHYPPPKEASRISWGQTLSEMELWRHTPKKSPVKTTPILTQKENSYPYEDDNPSPIVLTKMRKPKSFTQKYKNWPWS